MNPFEALSDLPVLHICTFLHGKDLLSLSEVNKRFKKIVTKSKQTMNKIRFVLNFVDKDFSIDFATELAKTRRFTALKLKARKEFTDIEFKRKLRLLLESLSGTVDDLIMSGTMWEESCELFPMFLPKLRKCGLKVNFAFDVGSDSVRQVFAHHVHNHPLESLTLIDTSGEAVNFFPGCQQLKSFRYETHGLDVQQWEALQFDIDALNDFLAPQSHLEKLTIQREGLVWNRMTCFQLKELSTVVSSIEDQQAASEFLVELPDLTKFTVGIMGSPSRRFIETVCKIPKIKASRDGNENVESLDCLKNFTVKKLRIHDKIGVTGKLLPIFQSVESAKLHLVTKTLDLSDVAYEMIEKIELDDMLARSFVVKFSPMQVPVDIKKFQSAVFGFVQKRVSKIAGITIGHENWRSDEFCSLSTTFCENLVSFCGSHHLRKLELFNVASHARFVSYLDKNKEQLVVKSVYLHTKQMCAEPHQMKIQID